MSDGLRARLTALLEPGERVILGITGCPGSGKSTLAEWVLRQAGAQTQVAWVPMDGYHLADSELDRLGLRGSKGAIDTFDAYGYLATLRRIRSERANIVYAPEFDREIEQPIAGGMAVTPADRLIVTEGNYLLDASPPWPDVRAELDEVWYCEVSDELRRERLVARHVRFGKTPDQARRWVDEVDEANAGRIVASRDRADLIVPTDTFDLLPSDPWRPGS
ncbi:nucleoside/nucleotide kinase family protein [Luethyella okanaganae]|uniref:Nucleoside/nucleotide kinase family protein n=1 Tax=Luethyella okanaganae TaxID=69372 RepID=A0ABW1VI62_9MICO